MLKAYSVHFFSPLRRYFPFASRYFVASNPVTSGFPFMISDIFASAFSSSETRNRISAAFIFSIAVSTTEPVSIRKEALMNISADAMNVRRKNVIMSLFCFLILFFAMK